jgi:hypothetical protein
MAEKEIISHDLLRRLEALASMLVKHARFFTLPLKIG